MRNVTEWSVEFDLLYNNIMSNKAPGLNAYEKSVFLTDAQENVIVQLYRGTIGDAFESTEEVTAYLASIVCQGYCDPYEGSAEMHIVPESKLFKLPEQLWFRTYEGCNIYRDSRHETSVPVAVVPVTQDEFWRTRRDPFKRDGDTRVLRLTFADNECCRHGFDEQSFSEIVSKYDIKNYFVRYIRKPKPIILEDLSDTGLSIRGEVHEMTCYMPEVLHKIILAEAVRLAQSAWSSNNQ